MILYCLRQYIEGTLGECEGRTIELDFDVESIICNTCDLPVIYEVEYEEGVNE